MRLCVLLLALPLRALAADNTCDQPRPRDVAPLLTAIQQDDVMSAQFEVTSTACNAGISIECDKARLKCGELLTQTLQKQVGVDDGMWLRDMLLPFQGQRYALIAQIPMTAIAQDVSCNGDGPTLRAAAQKRKQLAQKRRDIINEYPKWAQWAGGLAQQCRTELAARTQAQQQASAQAQAQANAALAAKTAEEQRQAQKHEAELAAARKFEEDKKAKEDAERKKAEDLKAQQLLQAELQRKQLEAQHQMMDEQALRQQKAQEDARRAAMDAEEKKKAEEAEKKRKAEEAAEKQRIAAQAAADAKLVAEREARKSASEKRVEELQAQEDARRAAAAKQIAEAGKVDRSDERLRGSIGAHAAADYLGLTSAASGVLAGASVLLRYGIWMTAPANGMSSGLELKVGATFLAQVSGPGGALFMADPELRWYFARFGIGATFEWRHLQTAALAGPQDSFAVGGNISLAIVDTLDGRVIATLRWLPGVFSGVEWTRINGEVELGYKYFSAQLQAGTISAGNATPGWFVGLGLGGRLLF
jgi:hypothetical protein